MKKIALLLVLSLVTSMIALPGLGEAFTWTREGIYADENGNLLSVSASFDPDQPGWYVGCLVDGAMYGGIIPLEVAALHGNIADPEAESAFVVTVSEEGEDGLLLTAENGGVYHFTPYELPKAAFAAHVNTDGYGEIAYAEGEAAPVFDDEYPAQTAYIGLEGPAVYTFAARPEDGWKFKKWIKNGEDYSRDAQITLEITEDTDLIAKFGIAGTDETYVDLSAVTTLSQIMGLPNYGVAIHTQYFVQAFEQDDMIYRAVAELPQDVADEMWALEWDETYDEKVRAMAAPLQVISIDNLTEGMPTQEELDALIGKTGKELLDLGWYSWGWNLYDMQFYFGCGPYAYTLQMAGEVKSNEEFEDADVEPMVVEAVISVEIGDPTWIEVEDGGEYLDDFDWPAANYLVFVNTDGFGQIAYAEGEETPEFDDEYPTQSLYIGLEEPAVLTFAAKPDDGWKFKKWLNNGAEISKEAQITLEITEDADLVAVFGIAGTNEAPVDLASVKTVAELQGLPNYGYAIYETRYVLAFEQDDVIYRAVAELPVEVFEALWSLEWDETYEEKVQALVAPLAVLSIDDLEKSAPAQEELDALIGKTGEELLADGWVNWGWYLDDMEFYFGHGAYGFTVIMEGEVKDAMEFDEEDINALVVKSVMYTGVSDPTYIDMEY